MATLDIRDYGAKVDGSTDDTRAVQDALDAASPGDTVYLPEGTIRIFPLSGDSGSCITVDENHSGVTLRGSGPNTTLKILGGVDTSVHTFMIRLDMNNPSPITDFTMRDFVVDGNKSANPSRSVIGIDGYPGGSGHDVLIEDMVVQNCSESGFMMFGGYVRFNRCTARYNSLHGFGLRPDYATSWGDWDIYATNLLAHDNGGLGADHNNGSVKVENFWFENNDQGGAKVPWPVKESWWLNGTFAKNPTEGFRWNGASYTDQDYRPMRIHLDNVVAEDNGWSGFWLAGDVEYDVGTMVARRNNSTNHHQGNVDVYALSELNADHIYSADPVHGATLFYSSDRHSVVSNLYHSGVTAEDVVAGDQQENLTVDNTTESEPIQVPRPARDEVGAWSTTAPETSAVLRANGGALESSGGILNTN